MPVHLLRRLSLIAVSLLALTGVAAAQNYPDRVVRLINPFPPGGSVDITGRILAQKLSENLGHQVIVENHAGAGGNTGSDLVAKSEPDGYTLLFTAPGPLVTNEALYTKGLPFNPRKDFVPIAIFAFTPIVLMVTPSVPAKNVQELIAYAKAHPSAINFGSAGVGSTPHLSGELFKSMAKIDIVHVPYRGTGPAMSDLMGGHIQMMFDLLPGSLPQIEAGKVRALANAGAKRPAALPDLPTVAEQGLPGFEFGIVGRACRSVENARGGRRQAAQRSRQGHQIAGHRQTPPRTGLGARNIVGTGGPRVPGIGDQEMG